MACSSWNMAVPLVTGVAGFDAASLGLRVAARNPPVAYCEWGPVQLGAHELYRCRTIHLPGEQELSSGA